MIEPLIDRLQNAHIRNQGTLSVILNALFQNVVMISVIADLNAMPNVELYCKEMASETKLVIHWSVILILEIVGIASMLLVISVAKKS